MNILQIQSLDAGYGPTAVLKDIHFTIGPGQFLSIVAPNGTGKSTLLKTIAGVLPPIRGEIVLKNKPLRDYARRELAQQIAVVSSDIAITDYTARQLVSMGRFPHIGRFSRPSAKDRLIVQTALREVGIGDKQSCLCSELSQGERQKVIIARALVQQPTLLLLDEPTAHLDVCNQFAILQLIKNLSQNKQLAVIAVLHDINLALNFSTHLLFLKHGRMLAYGRPQAIATPEMLNQLYDMKFTVYGDAAATFVMPVTE